ncbi:MAG TPA: ribonuclease P protein component [Thermomicrobiales bacterium]|jgi:ribonuclease P protein component|nr:ribonuclease P protein component [Thermomicrobiales bacterium]
MERRLRLRREAEVRAARNRGKAVAEGPLVVRFLPQTVDLPTNRYTVVAGKKSGGAVQRNRLKRLCREALRHLHPALRPGFDVVVIVRGTVDEMPDYATARATLERLLRRAGLVADISAAAPGPGATGRPCPPPAVAKGAS